MASSDAFAANGLTGATLPSRYAGATASGAPSFGSFAVGDFVVDRSGQTFICTAAGQPGTWTGAGLAAANTWSGANTFAGASTFTGPSTFSSGPVLNSCALTVPEGANAYMGTVAVNGSTAVTVTTTAVAATSRIFLTTQVPAGTPGAPFVASTSVATNFTLQSSGTADTSTVAWLIINHT
jgi:hypothetical protein